MYKKLLLTCFSISYSMGSNDAQDKTLKDAHELLDPVIVALQNYQRDRKKYTQVYEKAKENFNAKDWVSIFQPKRSTEIEVTLFLSIFRSFINGNKK